MTLCKDVDDFVAQPLRPSALNEDKHIAKRALQHFHIVGILCGLDQGTKMLTRFYVFRRDPSDAPFSATIVVTDLPADHEKKADALMTAFSTKIHHPNAIKARKSKRS